MANAPRKAVTKTETKTQVPSKIAGENSVPAYLASGKGTKLQHLDMSDFVVPRIKLLQGSSDEVKNFEEAKAGQFWMTVADVPLGATLSFIVCSNTKRLLLLAPMEDGQGLLARADDCKNWVPPEGEFTVKMKGVKHPITWKLAPTVAESGLDQFGTSNPDDENSPPAATLFYDYLVYLPEHPEYSPAMLSLARSQAKKAKDLNGKLELANVPVQSIKMIASVMDDKSDSGDFYNYIFRRDGWANEKDFNQCVAIAERFQDKFRASDDEYVKSGGASGGGETVSDRDRKQKEY